MAKRADLTAADHLFIGEDKSIVFTVYQSDGRTAQSISGWAISWMVKSDLADADNAAVLTKTTANGGITLTTPASGICTVTIADTDTDSLTAGKYFHELKRTDAGSEAVLAFGDCHLLRSVHRS